MLQQKKLPGRGKQKRRTGNGVNETLDTQQKSTNWAKQGQLSDWHYSKKFLSIKKKPSQGKKQEENCMHSAQN